MMDDMKHFSVGLNEWIKFTMYLQKLTFIHTIHIPLLINDQNLGKERDQEDKLYQINKKEI